MNQFVLQIRENNACETTCSPINYESCVKSDNFLYQYFAL